MVLQSVPGERQVKLSVIVPQALRDTRRSIDFLRSWRDQAVVDPSEYEIVVAIEAGREDVASRCHDLLRTHDRLITARGENAMHYYEHGVRAAQGRLLLFTEDHVRADPGCVREVLAFFEGSRARAAFLRSDDISTNRFARHEAQLYARQLQEVWLKPGCWDRMHLRGCVIDRELLHAAGGFPWRYGLFCSRLLASRIHRLNEPIEYCQRALIYHVNTRSRRHLHHEVRSYVLGECKYREEQCRSDDELYSSMPEGWRRRDARSNELAHEPYKLIGKAVASRRSNRPAFPPPAGVARLLREAVRMLPEAVLGARASRWVSALVLMRARASYELMKRSRSRGVASFERLWNAMAEYERARYRAEHPAPAGKREDNDPAGTEASARYIGFHEREAWNGRSFRWSEPVAMLTLELEPGSYRFGIDTGGVRGQACDFHFDLYFNRRHLDRRTIEVNDGWIEFSVSQDMFDTRQRQRLSIVSAPVRRTRRAHEPRRLGMPVFAIRSRPIRAAKADANVL